MSTKPVHRNTPAVNSTPNLLSQIGQAWKDLVGGKYAGTKSAQKKPGAPTVKADQPQPKQNKLSNSPGSKPNIAINRHTPNTVSTNLAKREASTFDKEYQRKVVSTSAKDRQTINKVGSALNEVRTGNFARINNTIIQTASNPQLTNSRLRSIGSVMAHSGIIGVNNIGQSIKSAADASDAIINMAKAAPKFFTDTGDLIGGRTETSKRAVAAGAVSGIGNAAYSAVTGTATSILSVFLPGYGADMAEYAVGRNQQKLDNAYRSDVKKLGVNPDSKGYKSISNLAGVVTQVAMAASGRIAGKPMPMPKIFGRGPAGALPSTVKFNLPKLNKLPGKNNIVPLTRKPNSPLPRPTVVGGGGSRTGSRGPGSSGVSGGSGGSGVSGGSSGNLRPDATGGVRRPSGSVAVGGSHGGGANLATLEKPTPIPTTPPASAKLVQNIQRLKSGQQTPFVRAKLPTPVTTLPSVLHRAALVQNIQRVLGGQQVPITRAKLPTSVAPSKPSQLRTAPVPTASALTAPSKIPASARLTTAAPVITKPVITKPVITKPYAHPATPTLPHITQPIGVPARPLLPATTPQRQTAQPLGAPASPKPEKKPAEQPLTTRPVGVPTGWIPTVPAVDLNPASKPQRRGYGDPPLKPEGNNPHVQSDIERAFKKQGAKNAEQREVDYSSGRITREAALNGATGEDRAKMNDALNRIDRGKVGGSNGGSGASSGIRSSAQVKDVWQEVDKKGGIDAMPESAVRHLKGVTEQGLKNTDLTPAERGDLSRRLEETNRAQGQHHKAREATKNNPPVNPSSWNLPMGKTVFGTQAAQPHWQPSRPNSNASASANNVAPSTANNTPNTSSTVNGSETSQVQQTNAPSSVEATPAPTSVFEGRSEKNKFEILPSTLVRVASGLAVRVNDLTESQKLEHNRLTSSGLSKADINEIVNHLSVGSVDDLANKYSQLSADNLAGVSLLLYGLNGPASIHDLSHALIGDRKSMAFDASERGEASGHALLNDFITDPQGIYDGFSVGRGADQNPVVSMTPTAKQTALNEFGKARGQSTRVDKVFSLNFNGNSFKRARKALQDSAAAGLDPKVWPSRFEVFYNSLAKSGQLPKKHDAALAGKLRESFSKYEADTRTMDPAQTKETTSQAALYEIAPILMRAASREFKKIPTDQKLRFYADGIAAVLAINNASPAEVQKPTGKNDDRFNYGWVGLPTSESVAFTKPGFLKDYLEIRNQVRQMLGVPSQSARDAVK